MKKIEDAELLSSKIHAVSDKIWKVSLFGPDNYRSAVISHFVRSNNKKLKKPAYDYASDLLEDYIHGGSTYNIEEQALQQLIGFKEVIPFP
ncbi:MAG: hypothetical protein U5K54_14340 [Cytophagales bacterium]|nr:hypothetical protein [Cytophagales bacterium]